MASDLHKRLTRPAEDFEDIEDLEEFDVDTDMIRYHNNAFQKQ